MSKPDDILDEIWKIAANEIRQEFDENTIRILLKILWWTKADKNPHFFEEIVKRIDGYRNGLKILTKKKLIYLVKGKGPYRILDEGIKIAYLICDLQVRGLLPLYE